MTVHKGETLFPRIDAPKMLAELEEAEKKAKGPQIKVEPVLPEVVLPGKLTWGSKDEEIRGLFGEASFSGSFFDKDFDHMYENGSYMIELGGMNDTGIEYIVYCVE